MAQEQVGLNLTLSSDVTSGVTGVNQMNNALNGLEQAAATAAGASAASLESISPAAQAAATAISRLNPASTAAAAGVSNLANAVAAGTASFATVQAEVLETARGFGVYQTTLFNTRNEQAQFVSSLQNSSVVLATTSNAAVSAARGFGVFSDAARGTVSANRILQTQARAGQLSFVNQAGAAVNAGQAITSSYVPALSRLNRSMGSAGGALTDFNRILQDAPFGFIAIQNNIPPLIDSFGRLSAASGGFGGALRALGGALLGPAGIGFAVSAVTSALTFYFQSQQRATRATKEAEEAIKSLATINKEFNTSAKESAFAANAEAVELNKLLSVAADDNASRKTRTSALNELKSATNGYLSALTLETAGTEAARKSLDLFNQSLFQSALAKAYQGKIDALGTSYAKIGDEIDTAKAKLAGYQNFLSSIQKGTVGFKDPNIGKTESVLDAQVRIQGTEIPKAQTEINALIAKQNALLNDSLSISEKIAGLKIDTNPFGKAANKEVKEVYSSVSDLHLLFQRNKSVADTFWQDLFGSTKSLNIFGPDVADLEGQFGTALSGFATQAQAKIQAMIKPIVYKAQEAKIELNSALSSAFSGLGDTIGKALAGGGLQEAFAGVLGVFANFIKSIGESLVAAGTAMIAAKILIKNPVTAIAAGVAAIAISSLLQAKINASVPRYAKGGMAIGEQLAIVGDNPSGREAIIPSEDFDKIGGGNQMIIPSVEISGEKLMIVFNRANSRVKNVN